MLPDEESHVHLWRRGAAWRTQRAVFAHTPLTRADSARPPVTVCMLLASCKQRLLCILLSCTTTVQVPHSERLCVELRNVELEMKLENLLGQLLYFQDVETEGTRLLPGC